MPIHAICGVRTPMGAEVIASPREVANAIKILSKSIQPWIDESPASPVVLLALLNGANFYADRLTSELRASCRADFSRFDLKVSTRDSDGRPLTEPRMHGSVQPLEGRRVLIVDDILDTGITLRLVGSRLREIAAEVKSTVLVKKDDAALYAGPDTRPQADYVGLQFRDARWFSGAGMDMPGDPPREFEGIIAYPPQF